MSLPYLVKYLPRLARSGQSLNFLCNPVLYILSMRSACKGLYHMPCLKAMCWLLMSRQQCRDIEMIQQLSEYCNKCCHENAGWPTKCHGGCKKVLLHDRRSVTEPAKVSVGNQWIWRLTIHRWMLIVGRYGLWGPLDARCTPDLATTAPHSNHRHWPQVTSGYSGVGRRATPSPHLKYMVDCIPPRQVSQRTHGDSNGNAWRYSKVINNWSWMLN